MTEPLTVLFMPGSAYGPTNNCIGIGDMLRRRGHRVVFAAEASWKGRLESLGFTEDLVDLAPPSVDAVAGEDAGQFWKEFVRETAPESRKPTVEQLDTWIRPVWEELISGARYCQSQLTGIVQRTRPDVIIEDNVVAFPALLTAGVHFGKPTIVLPLFWDQYDNAQRMQELGLGVRLDTYRFTDAEMHDALRRLLSDSGLRERLADAAAAIQQRDGIRKAANLIERADRTRRGRD